LETPRVGARLQDFWNLWQEKRADPWIVSVLREGYNLEFENLPRLSTHPIWGLNSNHPQVKEEILKMIEKGALEEVRNPNSPGFYSRVFVVPKKDGKLRPVIDLKILNKFLRKKPFKMETPQSIRRSLQKGMWTVSLDLKDAYFQVPIHPRSRKFLRICLEGKVYQFRALPFGVKTAPWIFTKIFKQLSIMLVRRGVMSNLYLDDWLVRSLQKEEIFRVRDTTLSLAVRLGCVINWEKSDLIPTQRFVFVGMYWDLVEGVVMPAEEKLERLQRKSSHFLDSKEVTARRFQKLIGLLNSLAPFVPWGRIHQRMIQFNLHLCWTQSKDPQSKVLPVWEETLTEVRWWLDPRNLFAGVPLHPEEPTLVFFTDASTEGWGAHVGERKKYGFWSNQEKKDHINVLEMRAVLKALEWLDPPQGSTLLVKTDNTTVVAYINREGGTRSFNTMLETFSLFGLLQSRNLKLRARYLPGVRNVLADALSRKDQICPSEWSLHPQVVKQIFTLWGTPHIDLFATSQNKKLPVYVSPLPDPHALDEDALSLSWEGMWAYAYPPTTILKKVVEKVTQVSCELILVAPVWPAQPWFQDLLDLSVDHPRSLPLIPKLLKQTGKNIFHTNAGHLNLHAWRISNKCSRKGVSRQSVPAELQNPKEPRPEPYTPRDGKLSHLGYSRGVKIHSRPLLH
jgi:hypothetical protein